MKKFSIFLISTFFFASIVAGQAIRINVLAKPRVTLLLIDIVCIIFVLFSFMFLLTKRELADYFKSIWSEGYWRWIVIFLIWALISLGLNLINYSVSQSLIAFSYWSRLVLAVLSASFIFYFGRNEKNWQGKISDNFILWSSVLLVFGYLQIIFISDFSFMSIFGWDPHQGRMLSTFFDPNYFGTFLVLVMAVILGLYYYDKTKRGNRALIVLFLISWIALYLTYSRSAWLQGTIALPLIAFKKGWKYSLLILLLFVFIAFTPNRLSSRISQGVSLLNKDAYNGSLVSASAPNIDPSAVARGISLKKGWDLAKRHWLVGVGYNAYGAALVKSGISTDNVLSSLAGQGSDSSLLNIFATTGVVGLILFLGFFISLGSNLYKKKNYALFGFMIAWIIGSFFNNSILYILIFLPFIILSAIWTSRGPNEAN